MTAKPLGREEIVELLVNSIRQGQSVLLIGAEGTGKTAILHTVMDDAGRFGNVRTPIYCEEAATLKHLLRAIAQALFVWRERRPVARRTDPPDTSSCGAVRNGSFTTCSIGQLRRMVWPRLRSGRYALLLDHIGQVRGAYAAFLEELAEDLGVPIVAAVRSLSPREIGKLWWVGWGFAKIELSNLAPSEARRLIEHLLDREGATVPDREDFVRKVLRLTDGNPRLITRLCEMARQPRYQIGGRTDVRLLSLDLKIQQLRHRIDAAARTPLRGPVSLEADWGP
ncbi:MAG TPA: ATP-binding protein [Nitrospiraceae bacterium]|nr:ATP-binding protein [Nitrospiraceae bacterium]